MIKFHFSEAESLEVSCEEALDSDIKNTFFSEMQKSVLFPHGHTIL